MGFDDFDNLWIELEAVGKKYGYQLGMLSNSGDYSEDKITAVFHKEVGDAEGTEISD